MFSCYSSWRTYKKITSTTIYWTLKIIFRDDKTITLNINNKKIKFYIDRVISACILVNDILDTLPSSLICKIDQTKNYEFSHNKEKATYSSFDGFHCKILHKIPTSWPRILRELAFRPSSLTRPVSRPSFFSGKTNFEGSRYLKTLKVKISQQQTQEVSRKKNS